MLEETKKKVEEDEIIDEMDNSGIKTKLKKNYKTPKNLRYSRGKLY